MTESGELLYCTVTLRFSSRTASNFSYPQPNSDHEIVLFPASAVTAEPRYQRGVRLLCLIVSTGLRTAEKFFLRNQRRGWAGRGRSVLPCSAGPSYISFCTRSRCAPAPRHPRLESPVPPRSQLLRRRRSQSCMPHCLLDVHISRFFVPSHRRTTHSA